MVADQVEEVKSKVDLVEVISSYVPLKKSGRNFAGLCPFHSEKTPSFMVSPDRQVWKCFGCSEAGDVFTFVEKMEGWDFREALEELAGRVGVKLESWRPTLGERTREKLLAINSLVAKFYHFLLTDHKIGDVARRYLTERGIAKDLWEKFDLGYAPADWDMASKFLAKRGFSLADAATAGLVIARSQVHKQGFYDRFRNRLIFPLKDARGSVLGFSGRILDEVPKEPKYINTPETPIFNKGSLLFGLDVARDEIRNKNKAVLVEGEFDVLSVHKAGVANVVASKGTALTGKQAALLSRLCERVALCFDRDPAGDAASRRGIELLDEAGLSVEVVRMGKYKDPDEFCQHDPFGWRQAVEQAANVYDYFLESAVGRYDANTVEGKKKIGKEILPSFAKISDEIVRAHFVDKLANILALDVSLVVSALDKKREGLLNSMEYRQGKGSDNTKAVVHYEEYFLALFILQDEILTSFFSKVASGDFEKRQAADFWQWLRGIIKSSHSKSFRKLLKFLPKSLSEFVDSLFLVNISPIFAEKELVALELSKLAGRIKQASLKRQLLAISSKIKMAQVVGDLKKVTVLTKKFDNLSGYLKREVS